jgi:hypothetical protein
MSRILKKLKRGFLRRVMAVLIALDNLVAAAIWGYPGLTISAQMYRWELKGKRSWPRKLVDRIFWFDPDHCRISYENEVNGMRLPRDMRKVIECWECEQSGSF